MVKGTLIVPRETTPTVGMMGAVCLMFKSPAVTVTPAARSGLGTRMKIERASARNFRVKLTAAGLVERVMLWLLTVDDYRVAI